MHKMCKNCANYDHKNLKHTMVCHLCSTTLYKDGTESDPSKWKPLRQKTNADRIRAMSDEELAEFIRSMVDDDSTHDVACYG